MGGQIMPPVMGAVAFIMAETIDVPYAEIAKAAVIPALLYFGSAFWMVHLEAGKRRLLGLPKDQCPSAIAALRKGWYLVLPLIALIYLLFDGYTPLYSGTIGLALTVVLLFGGSIARPLPSMAWRVLFWVVLGFAAASFIKFGVWIVGAVLLLLVAVNLATRGGRAALLLARDALAEGAKTALPVGVACAIVGIIVGTMTLTGAATTFGDFVVSIGEKSLFLSLILTMVTCLILGMGIPTIPNYIITSSLAGPALLHLGVPLIVSHMFVFYFGILADLTPPVALAAFAAAPIAKESGLKIGIQAVKIALAGFVIPFMAVYAPALMLQDGGPMTQELGFPVAVAYIVFKACIAIGLWGAAAVGFLFGPLAWWERILATAAAFSLVLAVPVTDEIGFLLGVVFVSEHIWRRRRRERAEAVS
jgi:TRAP transporter 4TM/12TM fusion protein